MKIAIHQMCSGIDPATNATNMVNAIERASAGGAIMYFAPEMSLIVDRDRKRSRSKIATEENTAILARLKDAARASSIWIHLGSVPVVHEDGSGKLANRTLVIDSLGDIRARYDKMHLFDVNLASGESWRESSAYVGGDRAVKVETPIGTIGLTICYDMRFPDLYSVLAKSGVMAFAVPAAFTVPTGKAHWHTLLRARAIEAEAYVIAAAQSGRHEDGRQTYGHSMVIDPWGDVLLDLGEEEGLGFVDIDPERVAEIRAQIPVHDNRRPVSGKVTCF